MEAQIRKDNLKYNYRQIQVIDFVMINRELSYCMYHRAAETH